jgi:hypothetical protein
VRRPVRAISLPDLTNLSPGRLPTGPRAPISFDDLADLPADTRPVIARRSEYRAFLQQPSRVGNPPA